MKAKLCRCNNCDIIMVDENPGDQPELETENIQVTDMMLITATPNEHFWGCPICHWDGDLIDLYELPDINTPN